MGEIRYIIIAKQCEVAGKSLILDGCLKKNPFPWSTTLENDFPCNLTQFCYRESYISHVFYILQVLVGHGRYLQIKVNCPPMQEIFWLTQYFANFEYTWECLAIHPLAII